jgi:hypothetical protein
MTKTSTMHDYARMGAVARLAEIQSEVAAIRGAFPELAGRERGHPKAKVKAPQPKAQASVAPKPKRKVSAAARKAMSEAQKRRWAEKRAG